MLDACYAFLHREAVLDDRAFVSAHYVAKLTWQGLDEPYESRVKTLEDYFTVVEIEEEEEESTPKAELVAFFQAVQYVTRTMRSNA